MGARPALVLLAAALAAAAPAHAGSATDGTAVLRLSRVPPGLEAELPRGGWYGRALAAARGRQYRRARDLFLEAAADLRNAASDGKMAASRAGALMRKAELAAEQCRLLHQDERGVVKESLFEIHVRDGNALFNLYLTSRAFLGRDDPVLYDRAAKELSLALQTLREEPPHDDQALLIETYLTQAGLFAAGGDARAARNRLSLIRTSLLDRLSIPQLVAQAYLWIGGARALLGDRRLALEALSAARAAHPRWDAVAPYLRALNQFDSLRDDPRFPELFGEEE